LWLVAGPKCLQIGGDPHAGEFGNIPGIDNLQMSYVMEVSPPEGGRNGEAGREDCPDRVKSVPNRPAADRVEVALESEAIEP
jgi:hypothetical protein